MNLTHPVSHRLGLWCSICLLLAVCFACLPIRLRAADKPVLDGVHRVLILGDSITYGGGYVESIEAWFVSRHPERRVEFINVGLPSETVSGLSEEGHAGGKFPRPDLHERLARVLAQTKPDFVIACYGMNCGIYLPFDAGRFAKYREGIEWLRAQCAAAGAKMLHVTPPTFDEVNGGHPGYGNTLDRYAAWLLDQRKQGWDVVDIHGPMNRFLAEHRAKDPKFFLAKDGVHCNETGHWLMAKQILLHLGARDIADLNDPAAMFAAHPKGNELFKLIQQKQRMMKDAWLTATGHQRPGMKTGLPLAEARAKAAELDKQIQAIAAPFPGKKSVWNGFDRYDFTVDGKPALVVVPRVAAPGRPWVWHGEFFGHKPAPDIALLGRGFHIVHMRVPDLLGSPEAVAHWNAFHRELTGKYGFAKKAALVGLSRGGLYCYNWAIANADKVACLYGDAPVCDFKSWPGGRGKGKGSKRDWDLVLKVYHFQNEAEALAYQGNPVDSLKPLAAAKVPLLHVFGDADDVVPWNENTGLIAERYKQLGGSITLIRKPGVNHHPHGLDDSTPIVNFIWEHTASPAAKAWLARHGGGPIDAAGRPLIRKLGTVDLDLVETTPIVFNNRLWRFEWIRHSTSHPYWDNRRGTNYFRLRDPATGEVTPPFADGHAFGSAFAHDGAVYVTGTQGGDRVNLFASRDLKTWESWPVIPAGRYGIFNTSLCRAGDEFVLMFEINKPVEEAGKPFTARFAKSRDLRHWTLTPPECNYSKDRYSAPHTLRWLDGWFHDFYLEARQGYEMRVVRSRDLIHWEPSPLNPVLRASPEDQQIANPKLTPPQRRRIAQAVNRNNSDIDFCEWQGRLVITYSWGDQKGIEQLAEAAYNGTEAQFLRGWFPASTTAKK